MSKELDIVLFGATGFTGKHAIPFIQKFSKVKNKQLTWGIAGRSKEKLKTVLDDLQKLIEINFDDIPLIIADVKDEKSIKEMVRKAHIIVNCCGPYNLYGEPVVKACVEEGTHYVDVSGEIQFLEKMQLKYHKQAEQKGVYIISACGFESIPADLGIVCMQQNFTGTLNSVEAYMELWEEGNRSGCGSSLNYGSWESMVHTLARKKEIKSIRQQLFPKRLPVFKPQLKLKVIPHKPKVVAGWAMPFHATDLPVIKRTQRYFYERHSKRPVQIETYLAVKSFLNLIILCIGGLLLSIITKFRLGQQMLLKYPEFLSFGMVSRESPDEERIEKAFVKITLYGQGWKETLPDANDQFTTPPNKVIIAEVKGRNPGYGLTNICLVLAAITVITETNKMPPKGGVYPPGYAFANTSLMKQLTENEVEFKIFNDIDK